MRNNQQWRERFELIASILQKFPFEKSFKCEAEVFTYNGKM